jgi:prophage antirepressor-like protein
VFKGVRRVLGFGLGREKAATARFFQFKEGFSGMNQVQIFENKEFGQIRIVEKDGQPWWVLKDVGGALGLSDTSRIAERLDGDELTRVQIVSGGQNRSMYAVSESGLYVVILRSDKPKAKDFRRWITGVVLPSIRKHGAYITEETLKRMREDEAFAGELAQMLLDETAKKNALLDYVGKIAPKARYYDAVLQCNNALQLGVIAKDYGMSAAKFNQLLHDLKIQYKVGDTWVLYAEHANRGYTVTRTFHVSDTVAKAHTYWTQRGRQFIYSSLKWYGIVPEAERL